MNVIPSAVFSEVIVPYLDYTDLNSCLLTSTGKRTLITPLLAARKDEAFKAMAEKCHKLSQYFMEEFRWDKDGQERLRRISTLDTPLKLRHLRALTALTYMASAGRENSTIITKIEELRQSPIEEQCRFIQSHINQSHLFIWTEHSIFCNTLKANCEVVTEAILKMGARPTLLDCLKVAQSSLKNRRNIFTMALEHRVTLNENISFQYDVFLHHAITTYLPSTDDTPSSFSSAQIDLDLVRIWVNYMPKFAEGFYPPKALILSAGERESSSSSWVENVKPKLGELFKILEDHELRYFNKMIKPILEMFLEGAHSKLVGQYMTSAIPASMAST